MRDVSEQNVRDAIRRGEPTVETGHFRTSDLDLCSVVADRWGRLWRIDDGKLTLIFRSAR